MIVYNKKYVYFTWAYMERWIIMYLHASVSCGRSSPTKLQSTHQRQTIIQPKCISEARWTQTGGEWAGSVCVCAWGIEGGGHHVIIWHLQCPTLQICEDGEQKICLLWSPVPHSLLCGWSPWIIHSEGHRHMRWKKRWRISHHRWHPPLCELCPACPQTSHNVIG